VDLTRRVKELEAENAALVSRIESVTERTEGLLERVRFTRQQTENSTGDGR